jgi:HEPN domain-containing protein
MFKKVSLTVFALIFAVSILGISVIRTSAQSQVKGVETKEETPVGGGPEVLAGETQPEIDYSLPYPGAILPGHFLYPLKMARDKIWLWLTTDSQKKAELLLHLADKRLETARVLIEGGKADLGVTTATKAEKYLEQAINQERVANKDGKNTREFLEKLSKASLKHEEVLLSLKEKLSESAWSIIDSSLGYARRGYLQVKQVLGE